MTMGSMVAKGVLMTPEEWEERDSDVVLEDSLACEYFEPFVRFPEVIGRAC